MWDLIVSVPDHCLSFYFTQADYYVRLSPPYPPGSIAMKNASDTRCVNTSSPIHKVQVWVEQSITSVIHTRC